MEHLINTVHHADCFDLLAMIPDGAVDAIITDLPYGTTACSWDTVIPFEPMWAAVKRVLKPRGVFVTTASQPFTSALVMSNPKWFKYEWIWDKGRGTNFQLSSVMPMKSHEDVLVFARSSHNYYPQYWQSTPYKMSAGGRANAIKGLGIKSTAATFRPPTESDGRRYPLTILDVPRDANAEHPTAKPVPLYEYLIRTYTQADDVVLDFCCGSGTTAVAARNTGRRFIAGDSAAEYVAIARDRLRMPFEPRQVEPKSAPLEDLPLFAIGD